MHWRRELRDKRNTAETPAGLDPSRHQRRWRLDNGSAFLVIVVAKFAEAGWITIVATPCVILLRKSIKRYYDGIDDHLRDEGPLEFRQNKPPIVLVATREWNRLTDKAFGLAMQLAPDVMAVHLVPLEGPGLQGEERKLREQWAKDVEKPAAAAHYLNPPKLVFRSAPYRRIHVPLLKLIRELEDGNPDRTIAVLVPELVKRHWWEYFLSSQRAWRLRSAVLDFGGKRVVVACLGI